MIFTVGSQHILLIGEEMKRREEGSIEERVQGRKYLIRWSVKDESGKSRRMNQIVNGDYVEAQAELARKLRPAEGEAIKPERTFASYCDNEWVQYTSNHWKWTTQITAGAYVKRYIRPFFDTMILSKITPSDVVGFHRTLDAKGLSSKTRRNIHAILSTMFTHATETLELIGKSPIKKELAPKVER